MSITLHDRQAVANARTASQEGRTGVPGPDPKQASFLRAPQDFEAKLAEELEACRLFGRVCSVVLFEIRGSVADTEEPGVSSSRHEEELVEVLRSRIRQTDIVARLGEGQWALLMPHTPEDGARKSGVDISQLLASAQITRGAPGTNRRIDVCFGAATYPQDAEDGVALVNHARQALARVGEDGTAAPQEGCPPKEPAGEPNRHPHPVQTREPDTDRQVPVAEQADPSVSVLVVDDEQSIRGVVSQVLEEDGYDVETADSGEAALLVLERQPHRIVITDIRMGGMDGIELLQEVKALHPDTLVVIMTSYASIETATAALRSGAYDYLIKPFEDLSLISAVANRAADTVRLQLENRSLVARLKRQNEQLKRANRLFKELSVRDGLTGLHNHRFFQEALSKEVTRAQRHGHGFSLVMLDVDHFKQFNDTHGHQGGDKVLRGLAKLLVDRIRKSDLAARYGGEEFVLLLPETLKTGALTVAEKIRQEVEQHPFTGRETQPDGRVTLCLGVATFPEDGEDGLALVARADDALYRAKHAGRNLVFAAEEG